MVFTTRAERLIFTRLPRFPRLIAPLVSLALAILACGITPTVTRQPASHLRLSIAISGQYTGNTPIVLIDIRIYDSSNNALVFAPKSARLTCEGADVKPDYETPMRECPRQPPGGAYHFLYTDEHGASTSAVIPVPLGTVALLLPRSGAKVAIPRNNTLDVHYTVPTPPPDGNVSLDQVTASCGYVSHPPCGDVAFGQPNTKGRIVSGGVGVFHLAGDFSTFQPQEGSVDIAVGVHVPPRQNGFAAVDATFSDSVAAIITWTR